MFSDFDETHTKTKRIDPKAVSFGLFLFVLLAPSLIVVYQNRMSGFPHSFLMRAFTYHNLAKSAI